MTHTDAKHGALGGTRTHGLSPAFTVPLADPSPGQPTPPHERLADGRRGCPPHRYLIPSTDKVKGPILMGVCIYCGDEKPHPREPDQSLHGRPIDWHRKGQGDDE